MSTKTELEETAEQIAQGIEEGNNRRGRMATAVRVTTGKEVAVIYVTETGGKEEFRVIPVGKRK